MYADPVAADRLQPPDHHWSFHGTTVDANPQAGAAGGEGEECVCADPVSVAWAGKYSAVTGASTCIDCVAGKSGCIVFNPLLEAQTP